MAQVTQVTVEDPTAIVGRALVRAKRIIFEIPLAVKKQMQTARVAAISQPEYKVLLATRLAIRANQGILSLESASDEQIITSVKALRSWYPQQEALKEKVSLAGQQYRDRATELRAEMKKEKEELAKDYTSEVITELLRK